MQRESTTGLRVCWVDTMRYTNPLSATQAKKWQALTEQLGVKVYVTSFAPGLRPRRFSQYAHFILYPQLPIAVLRYLTLYTLAPIITLWLIFTRGVDVLIAHDPNVGFAAALAKQAAALFGRQVALVVETRGDFEQNVFHQRRVTFKALYRRLMRWTARYALRHADALRAVSAETRDQLLRWQPDKPITQFMSWTDAGAFVQAQRPCPPSQSSEVVFAGTLVPGKGVHLLIEAFARLAADFPQARLMLIGQPKRPDYLDELRAQLTRLGLAQRVTFAGHMTQPQLAAQMARARVFVLPTYTEGLPKVVIEAQFTGTPVIATRVGGIPELIEDGVTGWMIPPDDVDALAVALRHAFAGADVDAVGARGRAFAMQFFSPQVYVRHYGDLFLLAYNARRA